MPTLYNSKNVSLWRRLLFWPMARFAVLLLRGARHVLPSPSAKSLLVIRLPNWELTLKDRRPIRPDSVAGLQNVLKQRQEQLSAEEQMDLQDAELLRALSGQTRREDLN